MFLCDSCLWRSVVRKARCSEICTWDGRSGLYPWVSCCFNDSEVGQIADVERASSVVASTYFYSISSSGSKVQEALSSVYAYYWHILFVGTIDFCDSDCNDGVRIWTAWA